MTADTFEDRRRCPKCQQPGFDQKQEPAFDGKGSIIHHIYCKNENCEWYNTPWLVQVNADGSLPEPIDHTKSPKEYRGFEFDDETAAAIERNLAYIDKLSMQKDGHGEIQRGM